MIQKLQYIDWGLIDYQDAWAKQKVWFNELIEQKTSANNLPDECTPQRFIVCEHPHVYTLGKNGKANNLLVNDEFLKKIHASYYHIERGGDITYHGPGQIVGYPILDLEQLNLSLKEYVYQIEEAIIRTLSDYQINASRMSGATGVWLDVDGKNPRKICAVGVRASRHVTMHGFALNVNTDLSYFSYINPCGFLDKGVTSLSKELQKNMDMDEVKHKIFDYFQALICK
ncbi:MAG: lipoyl(octanoyl) transferase LipB [Bacteroidales bacterium]|jgi:lipoyl(octanoyl) transferase|nr:lipoyl(octanoyl) transferase LipB [Bacteroidales bacterium]